MTTQLSPFAQFTKQKPSSPFTRFTKGSPLPTEQPERAENARGEFAVPPVDRLRAQHEAMPEGPDKEEYGKAVDALAAAQEHVKANPPANKTAKAVVDAAKNVTDTIPFRAAQMAAQELGEFAAKTAVYAGGAGAEVGVLLGVPGAEALKAGYQRDLEGINRISAQEDARHAKANKESWLGETAADITTQAGAAVIESLGAGALSKAPQVAGKIASGVKSLAAYYAGRSYQDALAAGKSVPVAMAHGGIDGAFTLIGARYGAGTSRLAGQEADTVVQQAVKRVSEKYGLQKAAEVGASTGVEIGEELSAEVWKLVADVMGGEELPSEKDLAKRILQTAAVAGLAGGGSHSVKAVADTLTKRLRALPEVVQATEAAYEKVKELPPDEVAELQQPLGQKEFTELTGIKKTTKEFRETFQQAARAFGEPAEGKTLESSPRINLNKPLSTTATTSRGAVRTWLQRNFTAAGLATPDMERIDDARLGRIAEDVKTASQLSKNLERAVKQTWGKPTPELIVQLDAALKGEAVDLPLEVAEPISAMRAHVDHLSRQLLKEGIVDPESELGLTIDENEGTYLTRTYRKHSEKNWMARAKANPDLIRRTKEYLAQEHPETSPATHDWMINRMLGNENADATGVPPSVQKGFESILKQRQNLPNIIRELYGEYKDPWVNYTTSIGKMAHLLATKEFMRDMKDIGIANGFLSTPDSPRPENYRLIDGSKISALKDLGGLYTDPNTLTALEDMLGREHASGVYRAAIALAGWAKWSATVGNSKTHIRNLISNIAFAASNGDWHPKNAFDGLTTTINDVASNGDKASQEYIRKLARLRVIGNNVDMGIVREMAGDILDASEGRPLKTTWDKIKASPKFASKLYQAEDAVWKIAAFENKKRQFARAFPDMTAVEIEQMAADDVHKHYPSFEKLPRAVKAFSKFPLMGPFVSFHSEVIRCLKNNVVTIAKEMTSGNAELRKLAVLRTVGLIGSLYWTRAVSDISKAVVGITDQEDEDLRQFQPPWSQNSQFLYTGKNADGTYDGLDLSSFDARAYLSKVVTGLLRPGDVGERFERGLAELVDPLGEDLAFSKVADVMRNSTRDGRKIYNEADTDTAKTMKMGWHVGAVMIPGTFHQFGRIMKGAAGVVGPSGRKYDTAMEVISLFGFRSSSVDPKQAFGFRSRDYNEDVRWAESGINSRLTGAGTTRPGQIDRDYRVFNAQRKKFIQKWHEAAMAAIRLGVPQQEVVNTLVETAGRKTAQMVMAGKYIPYVPSKETVNRAFTRPNGPDRVNQMRGLIRQAVEEERKQWRSTETSSQAN